MEASPRSSRLRARLLIAFGLVLTLSVLAVLPLVGAPQALHPAPAEASEAKIDPELLATVASAPRRPVTAYLYLSDQADLSAVTRLSNRGERAQAVVAALRKVADKTQPSVRSSVASLSRQLSAESLVTLRSYWIANVIAVRADERAIHALAALPGVAHIYGEPKISVPDTSTGEAHARDAVDGIEWNISQIRADQVWSTYGVTGEGIVIGNMDTGVDWTHPALQSQYRGWDGTTARHDYNWIDTSHGCSRDEPAICAGDHGTHTMGTAVGDDGGENRIGVAPGAKWIAAYGCCPSNEAILAAEEFMLAPTDLDGNNPRPELHPDIVNNSWGGPGGSLIFERIDYALRAAGIFPVYAAGNDGPGCGTIRSPGDNPAVFSVGATDGSDRIAYFSGRGPNEFGATSPDVTAPGVGIRSSGYGHDYTYRNGTSMAAPHVAGAVALIWSAEPKLRGAVAATEDLLRATAIPLTSDESCGGVAGSSVPNNTYGYGRIDVKTAVDAIWRAGTLQGTVQDDRDPIEGAIVSATRDGYTLRATTGPDGRYSLILGEGTWSVAATSYAYADTPSTPATISHDGITPLDLTLVDLNKHTVAGTIRDAVSGEPIPALIDTRVPEANPVFAFANGTYSMTLPAGTYTVTVRAPGYSEASEVVTVSSSMTKDISLAPAHDYICRDNREAGGPTYDWIDVTDGSVWYPADDAVQSVNLPSPFVYYGNSYSRAYIQSNGAILFGSPTTRINMAIPFVGQPNNEILGFAEDLNPNHGSQGRVFYKHVNSGGRNLFVVEWQEVEHWSSGYPETFEVILDLNAHTITVQYQTVSWPDFATVGVENADGTRAQVYSYANSAQIASGRAVQFTPRTGQEGGFIGWDCGHANWLAASADKGAVWEGNNLTFRIETLVVGYGASPTHTITASIPTNASFVAASGGITPSVGTLVWDLGNLRAKQTEEVWFTVTVTPTARTAELVTSHIEQGDATGQHRELSVTAVVYPVNDRVYVPLVMRNW